MSRRFLPALLALALAPALRGADKPADPAPANAAGLAAFRKGDYEAAAKRFHDATKALADQKDPARLDPAVPAFNEATTLAELHRYEDSAKTFQDALRTGDLGLQAGAHYNLGTALLRQGMEQAEKKELQPARETIQQSLAALERAITLEPRDAPAKANYEIAGFKLQEIEEELKQQQQQPQDQQKQDQQKQDQQKQDQQKQDQQKRDQQPQDQQKQDQQQQQQQQQQDQQKPDPPQDQTQQAQAPEARPEEMTPEEAAMLLDALRDKEQSDREKVRLILGRPVPVDKDW